MATSSIQQVHNYDGEGGFGVLYEDDDGNQALISRSHPKPISALSISSVGTFGIREDDLMKILSDIDSPPLRDGDVVRHDINHDVFIVHHDIPDESGNLILLRHGDQLSRGHSADYVVVHPRELSLIEPVIKLSDDEDSPEMERFRKNISARYVVKPGPHLASTTPASYKAIEGIVNNVTD